MNYVTLSALALLLAIGSAIAHAEELPDPEVLATLSRQEHLLKNVEIQNFHLTRETRQSSNSAWAMTPMTISGNAWYDGLPRSKARVQITDRVIEWENGTSPWLESQQEYSFDGTSGRVLYHKSGPVGKVGVQHEGELLPDAPVLLRDRYQEYADGTGFYLNYYHPYLSDHYLAKTLKNIKVMSQNLDTVIEERGGDKIYKMFKGRQGKGAYLEYCFDITHGCALKRAERSNVDAGGTLQIIEVLEVEKFYEAAPEIWLPIEASIQLNVPQSPGTMERLSYKALKIIANNPRFDERIYSPPFPIGYTVADRIHGGVFRITQNTGLDLKNAAQIPSAPTKLSTTTFARNAGKVFIGLTCFILVVSIVMTVRLLRRKGRTNVLLLLLSSAYCASSQGEIAMSPSTQPAPGADNKIAMLNCGVSVTEAALRWFGQDVAIEEIGKGLRAGEHYDQLASLAAIQEFCAGHGIKGEGFQADTLEEILQTIGPGALAIVRIPKARDGLDIGHYIIIEPVGDGFDIIDPPRPPDRHARAGSTQNQLVQKLAGPFLVLSKKVSSLAKGPRLAVPTPTVNLGSVSDGNDDFGASVRLENVGTDPLYITDQKASCGCMQLEEREIIIKPGEATALGVVFKRERIGPGVNRRTIGFKTNDPERGFVVATFLFDAQQKIVQSELSVIPRVVDYGRTIGSRIAAEPIEFTVIVPEELVTAEGFEIAVESSSSSFEATRLTEAKESTVLLGRPNDPSIKVVDIRNVEKLTPVRKFFYKANWNTPPAEGFFDGELRFHVLTKRNGEREFRVPFRGDSLNGASAQRADLGSIGSR